MEQATALKQTRVDALGMFCKRMQREIEVLKEVDGTWIELEEMWKCRIFKSTRLKFFDGGVFKDIFKVLRKGKIRMLFNRESNFISK